MVSSLFYLSGEWTIEKIKRLTVYKVSDLKLESVRILKRLVTVLCFPMCYLVGRRGSIPEETLKLVVTKSFSSRTTSSSKSLQYPILICVIWKHIFNTLIKTN